MKTTVLYKNTGEVVKILTTGDDDGTTVSRNLEPGLLVLEVESVPHFSIYVKNNTILELPERPSANHTFDYTTENWVDSTTLEDSKERALYEVNVWRQEPLNVQFGGLTVLLDVETKKNIDLINGFVLMFNEFPADWVGGWKTTSNDFFPITTIEEWKSFYRKIVESVSTAFAISERAKQLIHTSTTTQDVEHVVASLSVS